MAHHVIRSGASVSIEHTRQCEIMITIDESDGRTRAVARMDWHGRRLVGVGRTRPYELLPDRAAEKLSVSRALAELVARLDSAGLDTVTERPLPAC
jgi:Domain of unknown function (DUF1876)